MLLESDVAALHHLVAHSIHDVVAAVTVPVVSFVSITVVQWRMALTALIFLLGVLVCSPLVIRGALDGAFVLSP